MAKANGKVPTFDVPAVMAAIQQAFEKDVLVWENGDQLLLINGKPLSHWTDNEEAEEKPKAATKAKAEQEEPQKTDGTTIIRLVNGDQDAIDNFDAVLDEMEEEGEVDKWDTTEETDEWVEYTIEGITDKALDKAIKEAEVEVFKAEKTNDDDDVDEGENDDYNNWDKPQLIKEVVSRELAEEKRAKRMKPEKLIELLETDDASKDEEADWDFEGAMEVLTACKPKTGSTERHRKLKSIQREADKGDDGDWEKIWDMLETAAEHTDFGKGRGNKRKAFDEAMGYEED